ncbi:MAG: hypothetical protein KGZ84_03710 [Erysipelotrichia bacterium]|jgi:hypothetical protein|nr:hypothetical protein [Erysipelotrichia bacterium]
MIYVVLKQINNFGFSYAKWVNGKQQGYHCKNSQSNDEFYLVSMTCCEFIEMQSKGMFESSKPLTKHLIYVLQVDGCVDALISKHKQLEENPMVIHVLFDPQDEIEYFIKDMWNALIKIHKSKKSLRMTSK